MSKRKIPTFSSIMAERRSLAKEIRSTNERVAAAQDHITAALAILAPILRAADSHYVNASAGYEEVWVAIEARFNVESLKGERMLSVLGMCESLPGFTAVSTDDYCSQYMAMRTFKYRAKIGNVDVSLRVEAELPVEGEACRRVQVGTEIREVPVYALECAE